RPVALVRRQAMALAALHGYSIEELFGGQPVAQPAKKKRSARSKLGQVTPKYRDPDNKRNTWSGRGRMPRWLVQKTKHGRSATDFLIPGLARPTTRRNGSIGQKTLIKQT